MTAIVWTEAAQVDLERHYDFLAANALEVASSAVQAIVSAAESLAQNPTRGALVEQASGLRKLLSCYAFKFSKRSKPVKGFSLLNTQFE